MRNTSFVQKKGEKEVKENKLVVVSSVEKETEDMAIQKNGEKGYVVTAWSGERYPNGRKKLIREEVDTKKAAEKRERELFKLVREMKQNIETLLPKNIANSILFQDAADEWLSKKKDDIALSTWQRYRGIVEKHLLPVFGELAVGDITAELIQSYFDTEKAAKKLSGTSLRQHFVVIENVLKAAGSHVMYSMKRPRKNDTEINCIQNPFELKAFVSSFENSILYLPVFIGANTGMRLSEIAGLKWRDIDLHHGLVRVSRGLHWAKDEDTGERYFYEKALKTKNAKRTINISKAAINVLEKFKARNNGKPNDYVCKSTLGTPISREQISKNFVRHAKRQGYDISFHSLRHSHATILIMVYKVPVKTVSRRLGHSDITVTLSIYTAAIQEMDELAAAAMETIFAEEADEESMDESSISDTNDTANDTAGLKTVKK